MEDQSSRGRLAHSQLVTPAYHLGLSEPHHTAHFPASRPYELSCLPETFGRVCAYFDLIPLPHHEKVVTSHRDCIVVTSWRTPQPYGHALLLASKTIDVSASVIGEAAMYTLVPVGRVSENLAKAVDISTWT